MVCRTPTCSRLATLILGLSLHVSRAALGPGDIQIVAFNAQGSGDFAFLVTASLAPEDGPLYFTDNGYESGALRREEGTLCYLPPPTGLGVGAVVSVTNPAAGVGASQGTVTAEGRFDFSVDGDQILVYRVRDGTVEFLSALCTDSTDWNRSAGTSHNSEVPPGLIAGVTAIHTARNLKAPSDVNTGRCINRLEGITEDIAVALRTPGSWRFTESGPWPTDREPAVEREPLGFQGFEDSPRDTWLIRSGARYAADPGGGDLPLNQRIRNGTCSHQVINAMSTLELEEFACPGFRSLSVAVGVSATATLQNGLDDLDQVRVFVATNQASFSPIPDLVLHGRNYNARWSHSAVTLSTRLGHSLTNGPAGTGDRDDDGDGYSRMEVCLPPGTTSVRLKIEAINNSPNEVWCIDDISLSGTRIPRGMVFTIH
jgi:hypothetical protein